MPNVVNKRRVSQPYKANNQGCFLWLWRLKTYKIASLHVVISYDLLWQNAEGWQVENVLMFIVSWVAWRQGSEK